MIKDFLISLLAHVIVLVILIMLWLITGGKNER